MLAFNILLVDVIHDYAAELKRLLVKEHQIHVAHSTKRAATFLEKDFFDLVIVEIEANDPDLAVAIKKARQRKRRNRKTYVALWSGNHLGTVNDVAWLCGKNKKNGIH